MIWPCNITSFVHFHNLDGNMVMGKMVIITCRIFHSFSAHDTGGRVVGRGTSDENLSFYRHEANNPQTMQNPNDCNTDEG